MNKVIVKQTFESNLIRLNNISVYSSILSDKEDEVTIHIQQGKNDNIVARIHYNFKTKRLELVHQHIIKKG
jgi:hypothetical protein